MKNTEKTNRFADRMERYAEEGETLADEIVSPQKKQAAELPTKKNDSRVVISISTKPKVKDVLVYLNDTYNVNRSAMLEPVIIEFLKSSSHIAELCGKDEKLRELLDKL